MILPEQIELFHSLTDDECYIIKVAALLPRNVDEQAISHFIGRRRKIPKRIIHKCLMRAVDLALFFQDSWSGYRVNPGFLIYLFPMMGDMESEYQQAIKESNAFMWRNTSDVIRLAQCLHALLFESEECYRDAERSYMEYNSRWVGVYEEILTTPAYAGVIHRIDKSCIQKVLEQLLADALDRLDSLDEIQELIATIEKHTGQDFQFILAGLPELIRGDYTAAARLLKPSNGLRLYFAMALQKSTEGRFDEAFTLFDKALKIQRRTIKNTYIPFNGYAPLFYVIALMNQPVELSHPLFRRILDSKAKEPEVITVLFAAIYTALNEVSRAESTLLRWRFYLNDSSSPEAILMMLPVHFLCNIQPQKEHLPLIKATIVQAHNNGYQGMVYEAAYAFFKLFEGNEGVRQFYETIAEGMPYPPVLSRIHIKPEWEKGLEQLLGIVVKKGAAKEQAQSMTRLAYFYAPQTHSVRIRQQKQTNMGWSTGRKINIRTFTSGEIEDLTEHDQRIITAVLQGNRYGYYNDYFSGNALLELIGHPHLFLDNGENLPITFVGGKPQVHINKKGKIYTVAVEEAKPINHNSDICVIKETNTRYRLFRFNDKQQKVFAVLQQHPLTIPEEGKEMLVELLSRLSAEELEVHTTLPISGKEDQEIVNVTADSRVRVQLLPAGEGLNAELFVKPFGEHPPYCKAGKGGQILLRNQENKQLQVKRNFTKEREYENTLLNDIQSLENLDMNDGLIMFDDPLDSLYLLDVLGRHQDICVVEWPEGARYKIAGKADFGDLNLKVKSEINWFDLEGELKISEDKVITLQQLLALTENNGHGRFVELSPGEFLSLSEKLRKQLNDIRLFSTTDKKGLKINKFASLALNDLFDEAVALKSDKQWKEFTRRVGEGQAKQFEIPSNLQGDLRPYQEEGFQWLARLAAWEAGACLADDMGLGKTIQTLAILLHRAQEGPALVVCPVSVIGNWIKEATRFAPSLRIKTLGNSSREETIQGLKAGDVLVISYGLILSETANLKEITFATALLDEAHMIKNYSTKTAKATMEIKASFRIALTGTPVQNHLGEVWTLFNFINPGLLGSLQHFKDTFIKPDDENTRKRLRKLIAPFILRRTKTKVLDELPPKTEIVRKIRLSDNEMAYYELLRRKAVEAISESEDMGHVQVLAEITRLRQACCNPRLVDAASKLESSKMNVFLSIVDELIANNHRALVFSQFVTHLTLVRQELDKRKIAYQYLDGSTAAKERSRQVDAFQNGSAPLFLISLKAGGLGLNLTVADYVIHLDPWWNPAVEDQASDRSHRIGQKRPVTIYRLVTEQTIEEKIIRLHHTKRDLAESLLEGSDRSARLSLQELVDLIRESETD